MRFFVRDCASLVLHFWNGRTYDTWHTSESGNNLFPVSMCERRDSYALSDPETRRRVLILRKFIFEDDPDRDDTSHNSLAVRRDEEKDRDGCDRLNRNPGSRRDSSGRCRCSARFHDETPVFLHHCERSGQERQDWWAAPFDQVSDHRQ